MNSEAITEFAVLYPAVVGGPLNDILPCENLQHAIRRHKAWAAQGFETMIVHRTISPWTPTDQPPLAAAA